MSEPQPAPGAVLDELLLGAPRRYTRVEVSDRAGVQLERASALWRALGFPDSDDDEPAFTDRDVDALAAVAELASSGLVDDELVVSVTRSMGRALSGLADWQVAGLTRRLAESGAISGADWQQTLTEAGRMLVPRLEQLLVYAWRRHLADAAARLSAPESSRRTAVVFADLVDYTSVSRSIGLAELDVLVDRFEGETADLVAGRGGRVVKALGDEVLFVADDPLAAAEVALAICERHAQDDTLPDVRVGAAFGDVLTRFGDVYGPVVNIASRLTTLARPNTALVDRELAALLEGDRGGLQTKRLAPRAVRGYGHLQPFVVRRRSHAQDTAPGGG